MLDGTHFGVFVLLRLENGTDLIEVLYLTTLIRL